MSQPCMYVYPAGGMSLNIEENHANKFQKNGSLDSKFPLDLLCSQLKPGSSKKTLSKIQSKGGRIKPWPLSGVNRAADVGAWAQWQ